MVGNALHRILEAAKARLILMGDKGEVFRGGYGPLIQASLVKHVARKRVSAGEEENPRKRARTKY